MKNYQYQYDYADIDPQMYDDRSRKKQANKIVKTLKIHLNDKKLSECTILDVGSSTGIIDSEISKHCKKMVGIDIDKKAVDFAKNKFKNKNLTFKKGNAMKLDFKDNSFDVVLCTQVYEHVPDSSKLMQEINRVLKPGGICYFSAINKFWFWEVHYNLPFLSWFPKKIADLYLKVTRRGIEYYETPLSYWGLKNLVKKSGFKRIEYTKKIIENPEKFGYSSKYIDIIPKKIRNFLGYIFKYMAPSFIWILAKTD